MGITILGPVHVAWCTDSSSNRAAYSIEWQCARRAVENHGQDMSRLCSQGTLSIRRRTRTLARQSGAANAEVLSAASIGTWSKGERPALQDRLALSRSKAARMPRSCELTDGRAYDCCMIRIDLTSMRDVHSNAAFAELLAVGLCYSAPGTMTGAPRRSCNGPPQSLFAS